MKKSAVVAASGIAIFAFGILFGHEVLFSGKPPRRPPPLPRFDEQKCQYKFLNPLRCENKIISEQTHLAALEKKINALINEKISRGEAKNISVYYRDLQSGPIISINEDERFTPASLLKLPVMLMYYKIAETKPGILETKIGKGYQPTGENLNVDNPDKSILPDTEYTVEQLIEKMIIYSDNRSKELLLLYLAEINPDYDLYLQTINDLGIIADTSKVDDFITVKASASIFRVLYNGAYLNNEMSEKALGLLARADFKEGLVAGLPGHITVAHKFGDRVQENGIIQRHDCGIVYVPDNNYLLCVMTRGRDVAKLSKIISEISSMIYKETVVNK